MKKIKSILSFEESDVAQFRLKVIEFHAKHGTVATIDAFSLSRRTIFRWKKCFKTSKKQLDSLIPKSRKPKKVRVMNTHPKIISFIRTIREQYARLGKEKIKPLLDEYCREIGIETISVSTIGKVIKRHNLYLKKKRIYHNPHSGFAKGKTRYKTKVRYSPKVSEMGYLEIDTITKFMDGIRLYIFNGLDIKGKFQFSYGYTSLNSRSALDFFKRLELVYPIQSGIKTVQTDNGLEYLGEFDKYLTTRGIEHLFIYPRCPKINAYVERANRTLQEEFVDGNMEYAASNVSEFNRRLIEYLIWYNTKRVHKALGNLSPIDYLMKVLPYECHMYVTHAQY